MVPSARQSGKNIVLLSDGTGNSSAKLMKTNVWRMYEALDVSTGDQVALYDNGVGTSSFKPFAVLGGALGWGLKRNVRHLYMFACRNYKPATDTRDADRLYAFGFSRGAFTARVLIGLIDSQGLVTGAHGKELERRAKCAYREYRRQFNATKGLVTPLRKARDLFVRAWERVWGLPAYDPEANLRVKVTFLGLWDMVDAYGLPIDEMTRGWDQWVWPLSVGAKNRPQCVEKICHAVALDDERHTFHPVLLDEGNMPPSAHTDEEPVTQVWFAGMHSNVGGGYPDDSLAQVPLRWMAGEAEKRQLRLHRSVSDQWKAHADAHGPASDSRRGLGVFYRYNPRSIKKLTDDRFADVVIARPKIHESVFQRIVSARDEYAPIVLPDKYAVVRGDGSVVEGSGNPYEHVTQAQSRCADQERVWNLVWFRRCLYFTSVAITLLLLVPPFVMTPDDSPLPNPRSRALSGAIELLGQFLPGSLQSVTAYYRQNPVQGAALAGLLALLLIASARVQRKIRDRMRSIWDAAVASGPVAVQPSRGPTDAVYRFRSHPLYRSAVEFMSQHVFPFVFGVGALLLLVLIVLATVNRGAFALAGAFGTTCRANGTPVTDVDGTWRLTFPSDELCYTTGVLLERGRKYKVQIALPEGGWSDASHSVATPAGFGSMEGGPVFLLALPFRRVLTAQWFVPMARIGSHGAEYHPLDRNAVEITPRRTGQLFLFVNDAIGLPPAWRYFYANNKGRAAVTITREPLVSAPARKPSPLPS